MEDKKVLIIDDERDIIEVLSHFIDGIGFRSVLALNGEEGIDVFKKENPDLVLLDIAMPGMDGLEVLRRLRHLNFDVPVIIITAYKDAEKVVEAFRLGAKDCIFKPFDFEYLTKVIKSLI
jgi:DNA-binding response OmpR family regulator